MVDVKAFAQAAADKARNEAFAQGRELLELRSGELKDPRRHVGRERKGGGQSGCLFFLGGERDVV